MAVKKNEFKSCDEGILIVCFKYVLNCKEQYCQKLKHFWNKQNKL